MGWRSWAVVPERSATGAGPSLTGLLGFPWASRRLEAKCLLDDRGGNLPSWTAHRVDRHHSVIPDPDCSCGITAVAGEPSSPPWYLRPRSVPLVSGFVELSGRVIAHHGRYRAQEATIVGPLVFEPPRRPPLATVVGWQHPARVIAERTRYRIAFGPGRRGLGFEVWASDMARALEERYRVPVVALGPRED